VNKMVPKIGVVITLIGITIIIMAFVTPSLSIVGTENTGSNSVSYYSEVPYSQSITSPSIYSFSSHLYGEFEIYAQNATTGTYNASVNWNIVTLPGSSQQYNISITKFYNVRFVNHYATLNVVSPSGFSAEVNLYVYLLLDVDVIAGSNGAGPYYLTYTTPRYYADFVPSGSNNTNSGFELVIMYKNSFYQNVVSYNSEISGYTFNIPYQTTIEAEYLRPGFNTSTVPPDYTPWLYINGEYYNISYDHFQNYTLNPGTNLVIFGINGSGTHYIATQITEVIYVEPYNVTTLIIGIVVTLIGVVVLVRKRI